MSGYSKNPATAEKLLPLLQPLAEGNLCTWQTEEGQAEHLAYKIREALYIARLFKDRNERIVLKTPLDGPSGEFRWQQADKMVAIARMAERVRIVTTSRSTVEARLQKGAPEALVIAGGATPNQGYENPGRSVVTLTRQTVRTIQDAWQAMQPSNTPLHFPHAKLSYEELSELFAWAESFGLILLESDGALTIQRKTIDLEPFKWSPLPAAEDEAEEFFPEHLFKK